MMRLLRRARSAYGDGGIRGLSQRVVAYLSRYVTGGLSSRPRLEPISGLLRPVYNTIFRVKYGRGVDIMEEEWDTLILLDACRFDDFAARNHLTGQLESRLSAGADSREFIQANFMGRELHDCVYVTANPHVHLVDDGVFHAVLDEPLSQWDAEVQCVRPEVVTEAALRAHERFNDKRIIVHYMQPHDPPLGPTGDQLREEMRVAGPGEDPTGKRLFEAVASGDVSVERARKAYCETLDLALGEVETLLQAVEGRVVVSADHGEMFGESPYPLLGELYEHARHPRTEELCQVPWLVVEGESRRGITSSPPKENSFTTDPDIEAKLEALGYK